MFNKRLSSLLVLGILSGTLTIGCTNVNMSFEQRSLIDDYGYETLYKKDNKYKVKEQERATLGNHETIRQIFGESKLESLGGNKFVVTDYSGVKGIETNLVYDESKDAVQSISFVGDYDYWKTHTDEKQSWENFLYDYRRLGGYKYEDVLRVITDSDVTEEISDFLDNFLLEKGNSKHEGRTSRVVYINDNVKVYAFVDRKVDSKSKDIHKSVGIVFEDLNKPIG